MDLEDNIFNRSEPDDTEMCEDEPDPEEPLDPAKTADPPENQGGGDSYTDP
jgi:hypothetical protein